MQEEAIIPMFCDARMGRSGCSARCGLNKFAKLALGEMCTSSSSQVLQVLLGQPGESDDIDCQKLKLYKLDMTTQRA